ncbi:hypothetical protein LSTR_LSTR002664 [Laodelphax striatellus]|uniref:C2H2-type domain-containing protein n=1 Tax=Laodelphax striatellus TaxID=195883 RepID=A0A482X5R6_LAOST|nr:hypothetical protein LSTR_LSTR002664 [Laodelphax striatellus]
MTTKVKPAVVSDVKQHVNSTAAGPISVPEGFLAKPPLDADAGISSEEEEEDEEEGDDEEDEEPIKTNIPSRRTSSASASSQGSEGSKEKVFVKKEPTNDVELEKKPAKKIEEKESNEKKQIEKEPTSHLLNNCQIKLEKVSIVKVKKEPSTKDDEEEKNESSGNDSGVESGSSDSTNSTKDIKNIPPPKIGSLTILGPSLLNSSVKNGSLSITPANALASPLNALSAMAGNAAESASAGFGGEGALSSEYIPLDKLAMMGTTMRPRAAADKCEVCGESAADAAALESHRAARKHYKCCVAAECAAVVFETRADLGMHKMSCHRLQPTPPPSPHAPPPMSSPQLYCGPVANAVTAPQPQPGSIQPRSFASLAAPPSQQNTELLNTVNTNQLLVMKRLQSAPTDAPLAKGRRMDVGLDNGMPMQGAPNPVQLRPGSSVSISAAPQKGSANVVANLLATRGITVTPSGDANRTQPQQQTAIAQNAPSRAPPPLTLSSAISILPASSQSRQGSGFASPQARSSGRPGNQPPTLNLPTVDLTRDTPPQRQSPQMQRGRPPHQPPQRMRAFTCQVCDKSFHTRDSLSAHMSTHSSPSKLSHKCNLCNAQYPTQQGLAQHKQSFHKESSSSGVEVALPVVDLKQPGVPERLASLGIRHCIPLSQLQSMSGGLFGVPIIAIDSARSPAQSNLGGLGASNILSLGPLKSIPPR